MAEKTEISWCDATFNPWIGCTKISPACDFCYAERDNNRRKWVVLRDDAGAPIMGEDGKPIAAWGGPGTGPTPRKRTKTWDQPLKWNRQAAIDGTRPRVFCASLADVFDNEVPDAWRFDLWALLRKTPNLRWILLTKRIGNAEKMLPADWPFPNAGLMATLANQEEWDRDFRKLMTTPATWRGVSAEPLLGPINIGTGRWGFNWDTPKLDWLITGGESGPKHRPLDMQWVRDIRDQCARNSITFHHKQNGGRIGKENGCLIDGVEHKHFPPQLAA